MPGRKEAGQPASEKVAESRYHFGTTEPSINPEPPEGSIGKIYAGGHEGERHGAGADVNEVAEPEIDAERLSGEPVYPDAHLGAEVDMDQVTRVAEILRQHRESRYAAADKLIEEGYCPRQA